MTENKDNTFTREGFARQIFTALVLTSPFFKQYTSGVPGITLGDLLLIMGIFMLVWITGFRFTLHKTRSLIMLWVIGVAISLFSLLVLQDGLTFETTTRLARFSFYVVVVVLSAERLDLKFAMNMYRILCLTVSMYIIAQVLLYTVSGIILPFKILPISWYSGKQVDIEKVANFASAFYYRPSGIFIEPGFAAQFLLPGFVLSLYGWISGKVCRYKEAILILVALVLTTSTQAILIGAVLLAVFAIPKLMKQFKNSKRFVKVGIVMCALILCAVILNLEITQITISKLTEATRGGSSVSMRLYRGMAVFMQLPFLFKVLGIGHGNLGQFVMDRGIRTIYDPAIITPATADYANGMSTVALFYGVIGLGLLFLLYLDFLRHTKDAFRLIALAFILLSLVSNVFFDISIVFYFSLIYAGYRNEKVCLNSEDVISEADTVIS